MTGLLNNTLNARIVLAAESMSMVQDEEQEDFKAQATYSGNTSKVINGNTGFTIQDLLDDLNSGQGYELTCDGDGTVEGEYPIHITLKEDLEDRLVLEYRNKVEIEVRDGELEVKNKYGEWDGKKFKRYDGEYVKDDFVESGGEKYYFDSNGEMKTGEMKKGFVTYEFADDGRLISVETTLDVDKPMVALTYDDGPGKRTDELLDYLEENNAHATFFMIGQNIKDEYAELLQRMVDIDCEAANHSYSHQQLTKLSDKKIKSEINETSEKIKKFSGIDAGLLRPPYGAVNDTVRENAGMPMILWSIDTLDWKTRNAKSTIDHVMENVKDGDIILMHDIHDSTIDASKKLIKKLQKAGYQLVTVSELAEARGVELEPGETYAEFWKRDE